MKSQVMECSIKEIPLYFLSLTQSFPFMFHFTMPPKPNSKSRLLRRLSWRTLHLRGIIPCRTVTTSMVRVGIPQGKREGQRSPGLGTQDLDVVLGQSENESSALSSVDGLDDDVGVLRVVEHRNSKGLVGHSSESGW